MPGKVRCTVVKTPCELEAARPGADGATQNLLPWADPFIARLVAKYRLRAALDDSLHYLAHESAIPQARLTPSNFPSGEAPRLAGMLPKSTARFTFPAEGEGES